MNEVKILRAVNHPNIIKLEEVIDCPDTLFIVMELCQGGHLLDKMLKEVRLKEATSRTYFQQLASAVDYLHSQNICHRDLKLENILLCSTDEDNPVLKITDMGLSKIVDESLLKTFCGTQSYLAPEVIRSGLGSGKKEYTLKARVAV